jgi:hypothetical protein
VSSKIFLSYRREDSAGQAGRISDRLVRAFGNGAVFMDVHDIRPGINFVEQLKNEVVSCDAFLAVIGSRWLDAQENGQRRLDDPNDFVRIEISTALKRDILFIPILLDGTKIPPANALPNDLKELSVRNGFELRHTTFREDLDRLVRLLDGLLRRKWLTAQIFTYVNVLGSSAMAALSFAIWVAGVIAVPPLLHSAPTNLDPYYTLFIAIAANVVLTSLAYISPLLRWPIASGLIAFWSSLAAMAVTFSRYPVAKTEEVFIWYPFTIYDPRISAYYILAHYLFICFCIASALFALLALVIVKRRRRWIASER